MELEPMTSKELVALGQSPNVQGLPENVRHRVLWAILQATAANALEARLEAAAPVAEAVEWLAANECEAEFSDGEWWVGWATYGKPYKKDKTLPAAVAKLKERETQ